MKLLLDTNANLMKDNDRLEKENSRLHGTVEAYRKSFQSYIKDCVRRSQDDKGCNEKLRGENESLRRIIVRERSFKVLREEENIADTSMETSLGIDASEHRLDDNDFNASLGSSNHTCLGWSDHRLDDRDLNLQCQLPDERDINLEDLEAKDKRIEEIADPDVEEIKSRTFAATTGGSLSGNSSHDLLVDFGETRRDRRHSALKRWNSLAGTLSEAQKTLSEGTAAVFTRSLSEGTAAVFTRRWSVDCVANSSNSVCETYEESERRRKSINLKDIISHSYSDRM